jgi:outer membrane protein OmpA-like peptidoglycan-associated protein
MKKIFSTLTLVLCFAIGNAQVKEYLVAADRYFANGDYHSAAQYYEKYLGKGKSKGDEFSPYAVAASTKPVVKKTNVPVSSKEQIIYNLAECYRQLNFYEKAEPYYIQAIAGDKTKFPLIRFHYATTLRALGKNEEAAAQFRGFLEEHKGEDSYSESAEREIKNLDFIRSQMAKKGLNAYTIVKSPKVLNDTGATYAPAWLDQNTLLFTSTKPETRDSKEYTNRIYQVSYTGGTPGVVEKSSIAQPKDIHQGVVTVTPDGKTMFLSRWGTERGKKIASIYSSRKSDKGWSDPVIVPSVNFPGSSSQQPFVMPDGKRLVFSSDRADGLGGFDLWYADLDNNGVPGKPVNMGKNINTKYDEQAASYHAATRTLVFASNGRVGMGGYDFFYSKGDFNGFSEPKNFGYPVNSIKDDIYFVSRGTAGNLLQDVLFSSDRDASCCLELFSLNKTKEPKQISGFVVDCKDKKVLSGVAVEITDTINNKQIATLTTDAEGKYSFTINDFAPLKATATQKGYFVNSLQFNSPDDIEGDVLKNAEICLTLMPPPEEPVVVENVYFDYDRSSLKKESYPALDKLVKILKDNPATNIEINGHTDSNGSDEYNLALSDARARSVVNYLISKGIDKSRLQAKGLGETVPVEENTNPDGSDNPQGREKNRRTEFKILKN